MYMIHTKQGYPFDEASSAMQKAIRRGDTRIAGYFAIEFYESNMANYIWKRLLTISAEDCAGVITQEIEALHQAFLMVWKANKPKGRIFIAKAVILLCEWPKSRDADHLTNLIYDRKSGITDTMIAGLLKDCTGDKIEVPEYALDCHTRRGKAAKRTKQEFFKEEHRALRPRTLGLFDNDLETTPI
jgi:replication-associated recombination protein RarA